MSDLISRQAVLSYIDRIMHQGTGKKKSFEFIRKHVEKMPSETAKRIVGMSKGGMTMWYQCDMCHEPVDEKDAFCSGCGRRLVDE